MAQGGKTGRVKSADVSIFYRHFGSHGRTPLLLLHGANYYDSRDWIEVAEQLSTSREVVAFDARGFGESTWSPTKDYSLSAHLADILAVLDQLNWTQAVVVGSSRGGALGMAFAARHPERTLGLAAIDYSPSFGIGPRGPSASLTATQLTQLPKVFATRDDAFDSTSRTKNPANSAFAQRRVDEFIEPVAGGYIISKRDPNFDNVVPIEPAPGRSPIQIDDMWSELKRIRCPVLSIRATESKIFHDADIDRFVKEFPNVTVANIRSGHDVVGEAPKALAEKLKAWLVAREL